MLRLVLLHSLVALLHSLPETLEVVTVGRPLGYATLAVLQALADGYRYGFDVIDHTGLPSGTVYPALATLTRKGLTKARWEEDETARLDRRPRRKYYEVTKAGTEMLRDSMKRFHAMGLRAPAEPVPDGSA